MLSSGEMNRHSFVVEEFAACGRTDKYTGKTERQNNATAPQLNIVSNFSLRWWYFLNAALNEHFHSVTFSPLKLCDPASILNRDCLSLACNKHSTCPKSPLDCKGIKPVNPKGNQTWIIHWKDWCCSWSSNTLATWCKELTHWKRPWCWESLNAGGEGDDRGWDGWMASLTPWIWVWANSGRQWRTGKPGVL